jgi:hypothetical protein
MTVRFAVIGYSNMHCGFAATTKTAAVTNRGERD